MISIITIVMAIVLSVILLRNIKQIFGLEHPWWTHIPAMVLWWITAIVIIAGGIIGSWPVNYIGNINLFPTARQFALQVLPISLFFIGLSIFLDELWARQEKRKTFNWLSLLDEVTVGFIVASGIARLCSVPITFTPFAMDYQIFIMGVIGLIFVLFAILIELRRPYIMYEEPIASEDTEALKREFAEKSKSGERFAYWEAQNPIWQTGMIVLISATMIFSAIMSWKESHWTSFFLVVMSPVPFLAYGGLRVLVNSEYVLVRLGMLGVNLLTLPTRDIEEINVHTFAPLHDFGGYGIRINREMKAYYFNGNRGVKIRTKQGKKYLIGSDTPERLAAAVGFVTDQAKAG